MIDSLKGDNELTGPIPSEVGFLTELRIFNLQNNLLTGEIPTELGWMNVLWDLNLSKYLAISILSNVSYLTQ